MRCSWILRTNNRVVVSVSSLTVATWAVPGTSDTGSLIQRRHEAARMGLQKSTTLLPMKRLFRRPSNLGVMTRHGALRCICCACHGRHGKTAASHSARSRVLALFEGQRLTASQAGRLGTLRKAGGVAWKAGAVVARCGKEPRWRGRGGWSGCARVAGERGTEMWLMRKNMSLSHAHSQQVASC